MSGWKETLRRLTYLPRRARFEQELDSELEFHIAARADELIAAGLSHGAAMSQARHEFGSMARALEETRSAWQFRWLEDLSADLRYAARTFLRDPGFALTAIVCLALGIGANITIFSIANEVLFSEPSVRDPHTLVQVRIGGNSHSGLREYRFVRDSGIFAGLAGENEEMEANWRNGDSTVSLSVVRVTDNFFDVTGIPVARGRPIQPGESDTVVLTYGFWQRRLGSDPRVVGRKLVLDGRVFTVAGVLPRDHRTVTGFGFSPDLYVPVTDERTIVQFYARLEAGMARPAVFGRLMSVCRELDRVYPDGNHKWASDLQVVAISGVDRIETDAELMLPVAAFFGVLMVVVGLVLLIACANVASLLLARAASRSHEIAVRLSIGAGRGRIIRQLLAESWLLAACGTVAALLLNLALTSLLSRVQLPLPLPIQFVIQPDWRLLAYAATVAVGTSVAAGLMPAIQGVKAGIGVALKRDESRSAPFSIRNLLVVGQLAVSIVLLSASFLFLRNLVRASTASPGFDLEHTIWAYMRLVPDTDRSADKTRAVIDRAVEHLQGLRGVEGAAIARVVPLNDHMTEGATLTPDVGPPAHVLFNMNYVGPDYFRVMQIPIVQGRPFVPSDRMGAGHVAILNENLARRLFGATDAVGHTIRREKSPILIVGVARNSKYFTLGEENALADYEPYAQWSGSVVNLQFLVRAAGRPETLIHPIQSLLGQLDPTAAVEVKPMHRALAFAMLPSQVGAIFLGTVGILGLALASVGLYGVLLFAVSRRVREIGLRVALGATPGRVLRLVLHQSAVLTAVGIVIGTGLAVLAVRPLAMFLVPEVRTGDLANFVVVGAVLLVVALAATVAPALRAVRVDPAVALRSE